MSINIQKDLIANIVSTIVQYSHPEKVILFGSRAKGAFTDESDYDFFEQGDEIELNVKELDGKTLMLRNKTKGKEVPVTTPLSPRDIEVVRAGGSLAHVKSKAK